MILVDSSVWIDYFRGADNPQVRRLDALLGVEPLAVGDLIVTEVLQGFVSDRDFEVARRLLGSLEVFSLLGPRLAVTAARHYRRLRAAGITVRKTIDTVIATFCIVDGHVLLTADRDFQPFAEHLGLKVLAPVW